MLSKGDTHQRISDFVEDVHTSFWAIPSLLIAISVIVAALNLWLDSQIMPSLSFKEGSWLNLSEIESIRTLLATMAAAILGVAGVTFSITIASLTLASQQFGPRLIRTFMRDRFIQSVLGFFVATFVYCMLTIQLSSVVTNDYIPISTLFTVLFLTIADLVLLVLFIHHICVSIQVDSVIKNVADEMKMRAATLLIEPTDDTNVDNSASISEFKKVFRGNVILTLSDEDGYIRSIDYDGLLQHAEQQKLFIRVLHRAGDYVMVKSPLYAHVSETANELSAEPLDNSFCIVGSTQHHFRI